jgi:DNA polymerase
LWQGNLGAQIMVVGQDWGNTTYFVQRKGREGPRNPTNLALVELLGLAGVSVGEPGSEVGRDIAFFTNAILCLKGADGGLQGQVQTSWFDNCAPFLRRQIEIVHPTVVVGLGERAYRTILGGFDVECGSFRAEVEAQSGTVLPNGSRAFAVYHCGARIRNTHRPMAAQREDWKRLRPFLHAAG